MAYVRKTQELVDAILDTVTKMSEDTQAKYNPHDVSFDAAAKKHIYDAGMTSAWSAQPDLQDQMPEEWCTYKKSFTANVYSSDNEFVTSFTIEGEWRLPPDDDYKDYKAAVDVRYQHMSPTLQALVDTAAVKSTAKNAHKEKFKNIREQLKLFMGQHASLNTALKEMPELEMYVPAEFMRKHAAPEASRAKVQRPTNIERLDINVDVLTSAAVAHRIATA